MKLSHKGAIWCLALLAIFVLSTFISQATAIRSKHQHPRRANAPSHFEVLSSAELSTTSPAEESQRGILVTIVLSCFSAASTVLSGFFGTLNWISPSVLSIFTFFVIYPLHYNLWKAINAFFFGSHDESSYSLDAWAFGLLVKPWVSLFERLYKNQITYSLYGSWKNFLDEDGTGLCIPYVKLDSVAFTILMATWNTWIIGLGMAYYVFFYCFSIYRMGPPNSQSDHPSPPFVMPPHLMYNVTPVDEKDRVMPTLREASPPALASETQTVEPSAVPTAASSLSAGTPQASPQTAVAGEPLHELEQAHLNISDASVDASPASKTMQDVVSDSYAKIKDAVHHYIY